MQDFNPYFTPNQREKLAQAGFQNMYDFVTYLPYKLDEIEPFSGKSESKKKYIWQARLVKFELRKRNRPFFFLEFSDGTKHLQAYYFVTASYVYSLLKADQEFQILFSLQNGLAVVQRLAKVTDSQSIDRLVLGKAIIQKYTIPRYLKVGQMTNQYFVSMHQRLPDSVYKLDLEGLFKPNSLLPNILNLKQIHAPDNSNTYFETKKQWTSLNVYLRLNLINYLNYQSSQKQSIQAKMDLDFLKNFTSKLDFELTLSQKNSIWEILQEVTY
ncbi:MAG: hypothetical protein WCK98_05120 [bacterium]